MISLFSIVPQCKAKTFFHGKDRLLVMGKRIAVQVMIQQQNLKDLYNITE